MQRKILSVHLNKYMAGNNKKNKISSKIKKDLKKKDQPVRISPQPTPPVNLIQPDSSVLKVIRDALLIHAINPENQVNKRNTVNELDAMVSTCQEFLKSFIIIGYTFEGKPVQPIVFAHNQQEADALGSYLGKFIQSTIKEQDQNGG